MNIQIAQSNNLLHKTTKIQNGAPNNLCWCISSFRMKLIGISLLCFAGSILYKETIFDITNSGSSIIGGAPLGKQQSVNNDGSSDQNEKKISPLGIKQIILLGERHSGTNWITDYLVDCFGDDIKVRFVYMFGHIVCSFEKVHIICYFFAIATYDIIYINILFIYIRYQMIIKGVNIGSKRKILS